MQQVFIYRPMISYIVIYFLSSRYLFYVLVAVQFDQLGILRHSEAQH
jgi:uncharacterized membrane protein